MNEQTGAPRVDGPADPVIRQRRLDALQKAHRARQTLSREAERIERIRAAEAAAAAGTGTTFEEDVDRLVEIHRSLQHERHVARRPFHRHADRLVMALELAERLALERLGFDDYADFESRSGERPTDDVIDLAHLEQAARELAEAEAALAALDAAADDADPDGEATLPPWVVEPVRRLGAPRRPTTARRSLFDRPAPGGRPSRGGDDQTVEPGTEGATAPLLPFRRSRAGDADEPGTVDDDLPGAGDVRDPGASDGRPDSGSDGGSDGGVLGEIVVGGRTIRISKAPGLPYPEQGDEAGLRPDSITYGDPRWFN